jgi:transcriptional regulator GlxA family with amidase domain
MMAEPESGNVVEAKISRLIDCGEDGSICSTIQCNGILLDLISGFLHPESCPARCDYHKKVERFLPVLEYIKSNLDKRISVDKLAEMAHYERSHFTVLFKKMFGNSPANYINQQRVNAALLMLHTGEKKMNELAETYGFYDAYHLSKVVKRLTGKSPREHLREYGESAP